MGGAAPGGPRRDVDEACLQRHSRQGWRGGDSGPPGVTLASASPAGVGLVKTPATLLPLFFMIFPSTTAGCAADCAASGEGGFFSFSSADRFFRSLAGQRAVLGSSLSGSRSASLFGRKVNPAAAVATQPLAQPPVQAFGSL